MQGLLDTAWAEADKLGSPSLSRGSNYRGIVEYYCWIELPCPVAGGEIKVTHRAHSPAAAILGAIDKARLMIGAPTTTAAERITHATR